MADLLAGVRSAEPHGSVGQMTEVLLGPDRHAEVRPRIDAVNALAALRREQGHDVIALRDRGDPLADPLDDPGALVAEDGGRVAGGIDARGRVEVGVADAAGDEPHEHLARLRVLKLELLDHQGLAELLEHRRFHPHRRTSSSNTSDEAILLRRRREPHDVRPGGGGRRPNSVSAGGRGSPPPGPARSDVSAGTRRLQVLLGRLEVDHVAALADLGREPALAEPLHRSGAALAARARLAALLLRPDLASLRHRPEASNAD